MGPCIGSRGIRTPSALPLRSVRSPAPPRASPRSTPALLPVFRSAPAHLSLRRLAGSCQRRHLGLVLCPLGMEFLLPAPPPNTHTGCGTSAYQLWPERRALHDTRPPLPNPVCRAANLRPHRHPAAISAPPEPPLCHAPAASNSAVSPSPASLAWLEPGWNLAKSCVVLGHVRVPPWSRALLLVTGPSRALLSRRGPCPPAALRHGRQECATARAGLSPRSA